MNEHSLVVSFYNGFLGILCILRCDIYENSISIRFYKTWLSNSTYGGIVKAIAEDEIDVFCGLIGFVADRASYYTPVMPIAKYE